MIVSYKPCNNNLSQLQTGLTNMSAHSPVQQKVHITSRPKITLKIAFGNWECHFTILCFKQLEQLGNCLRFWCIKHIKGVKSVLH